MLAKNLLKLAQEKPQTRSHILPLLLKYAKEEGKNPDQWKTFLKEKYQGGKQKVPNPNPETRSQWPEVTLFTAIKSPTARKKVLEEYHEWLSHKNKPEKSRVPYESGSQIVLDKDIEGWTYEHPSVRIKIKAGEKLKFDRIKHNGQIIFSYENPGKKILLPLEKVKHHFTGESPVPIDDPEETLKDDPESYLIRHVAPFLDKNAMNDKLKSLDLEVALGWNSGGSDFYNMYFQKLDGWPKYKISLKLSSDKGFKLTFPNSSVGTIFQTGSLSGDPDKDTESIRDSLKTLFEGALNPSPEWTLKHSPETYMLNFVIPKTKKSDLVSEVQALSPNLEASGTWGVESETYQMQFQTPDNFLSEELTVKIKVPSSDEMQLHYRDSEGWTASKSLAISGDPNKDSDIIKKAIGPFLQEIEAHAGPKRQNFDYKKPFEYKYPKPEPKTYHSSGGHGLNSDSESISIEPGAELTLIAYKGNGINDYLYKGQEVTIKDRNIQEKDKPKPPIPKTPPIPLGKIQSTWEYHEHPYSDDISENLDRLNSKLKVTLNEEKLAELVGLAYVPWTEGAPTVTISNSYDGSYDAIELEVEDHWPLLSMSRLFAIDHEGNPYIHNNVFKTSKSPPTPDGWGARAFLSQVSLAQQAGFKYLECDAYIDPPDWYGAKVWPKLGYDGVIPLDEPTSEIKSEIAPPLPDILEKRLKEKGFKKPYRFSHLWAVQGGAEWWDKVAVSFKGKFDLTEGSYSMTFIRNYIKAKAEELGITEEEYMDGPVKAVKKKKKTSSEGSWLNYLSIVTAKDDKGHEQIDTDGFDDKFSQNYWKRSK